MSARIYWNLLVFFGVLCQGIIGTLSEKDIDESSELLVRQKRVINRAPGGDVRELMKNFPYVVSVKKFRSQDNCVGVILTEHIVLTIAKCVEFQGPEMYRVHSGTAQLMRGGHPITHNVTSRRMLFSDHPSRLYDGIALITVNPPFRFSINTHNIPLYEGHVTPGKYAIVSGWGCHAVGDPGTEHPNYLRSIVVPIISNNDCKMYYFMNPIHILDSDICTLDTHRHRYCGANDFGAPLVFKEGNMNMLVGVHIRNGAGIGQIYPDVFLNLQFPRYKTWIMETIRSLEAQLHNSNHNQHLHN